MEVTNPIAYSILYLLCGAAFAMYCIYIAIDETEYRYRKLYYSKWTIVKLIILWPFVCSFIVGLYVALWAVKKIYQNDRWTIHAIGYCIRFTTILYLSRIGVTPHEKRNVARAMHDWVLSIRHTSIMAIHARARGAHQLRICARCRVGNGRERWDLCIARRCIGRSIQTPSVAYSGRSRPTTRPSSNDRNARNSRRSRNCVGDRSSHKGNCS